MLKGMKTLEDIDHILHTLRDEISRINKELDRLFQRSQENKQQQSDTIERLSKFYFDEIEKRKNENQNRQTKLHKEIEALLEKREKAYEKLKEEIENSNRRLDSLESQRVQMHQELDEAAKKVIEKEHQIQLKLEKDEFYQAQLQLTRERKSIADEAEKKVLEAEQRRLEKGTPYEEDELFSYLWDVDYGTSEYRGKGIIKVLDGWVASLIDYKKHRVNYWRLLEIPKRLRTHADREKERYSEALRELSEIEHRHAKQMQLGALQEEENKRQQSIDEIDDKIDALEKKIESLISERQKYLEDMDATAQEILKKINALLLDMSLPQLEVLAQKTFSREDDKLVEHLNRLKDLAIKMETETDKYRELYNKKIEQLHEIEHLRVKFKRSRYDDIRSGFENDRVIEEMIGGLLGGLVQSSVLWDTLRGSQRHRDTGAWPDFGSGGFSSGNSAPWHFPRSREGGSSFNLPDLGGFSSRNRLDHFTTGGGF